MEAQLVETVVEVEEEEAVVVDPHTHTQLPQHLHTEIQMEILKPNIILTGTRTLVVLMAPLVIQVLMEMLTYIVVGMELMVHSNLLLNI